MPNKWDQQFSQATEPGRPADVLIDNKHLLPANGNSLEIACGLGANALLLAKHGLETSAWDSSSAGLEKLSHFAQKQFVTIKTRCIDLETSERLEGSFDVIVVAHYLYRPLCTAIESLLKPNGLLFYQTFTQVKTTPGGPNNPKFLLKKNELLKLFPNLSLVSYREERDCGDLSIGLRNLAYLVARKD